MTEGNGGRVTTREFYELQLHTNEMIEKLRRDVSVLIERQENSIKDTAEKFEAVDKKFAAQENKNEKTDAKINEIDEDMQAHEKVDNWFKGISGLIQAAIAAVLTWWVSRN